MIDKKQVSSDGLITCIIGIMDDMKAEDVQLLDLGNIENAVTSYFIICSGNSNTQVSAICEAILRNTRKNLREKPLHIEGKQNAEWILMDYAHVVVHIFQKNIRELYDIEGFWSKAMVTKFLK